MTRDDTDRSAAAADLARLVRRLRDLSRRAWSQGETEQRIRALAEALVVLSGEGHQLPADLPTHSLGDVIAVVGHDALNVDGAAAAVHALVLDALDATR
jgi:hypothetical protein